MQSLAGKGAAAVPALERVISSGAAAEAKCAAVWALARIDDVPARSILRTALENDDASVRQTAAARTGLLRDSGAIERLSVLVGSDTPPVRREAATALGRIGSPAAVPGLLEALAAPVDRFLEHATIFALIAIADREETAKGLASAEPPVRRGALIALDQMEGGQLAPEQVTPLLDPADPLLQQTALWVIAHHGDWGRAMLPFFRQWLVQDAGESARLDALRQQLLAFAGDENVRQLMADVLASSDTPRAMRLLVLEAMAQAAPRPLPAAWGAALEQSLTDSEQAIVAQTVATLRGLPAARRPVAVRVDGQVNYPASLAPFPDTQLVDHFGVRWSGILRVPAAGKYKFYTASDDGSWLWIDGKRIVDNGGSHGMREQSGEIELAGGDHSLRLEFIDEEGDAGCILSWTPPGGEMQVVPPEVLFHRDGGDESLKPGLVAEVFAGDDPEVFPDIALARLSRPLLGVALDSGRAAELRTAAAAAVSGQLVTVSPELFAFLRDSLDQEQPPLVRLDAAVALGSARLDAGQLAALCESVAGCGALELPKLLPAFEQSSDPAVGNKLVDVLGTSPGLRSVSAAALATSLASYPEAVREHAAPLVASLTVDVEKQKARLAALEDVLAGGEIARGRDLFFANQKAICATCHTVQGKGGRIGPDLTKIGAIRTPRDLLEAIVLPSSSFARGYEPFTLVTSGGQVHSGVITRETAEAIYVFNNARVEIRVPRSDVEALAQSTVSIMPEGMDAQLSRQELADLIAFLQSLR